MANELLIKKRIEVVKENMVRMLRSLSDQYERGEIKSPAELQHKVYDQLQKFYESIGHSTLRPIEAWGAPYSNDHNKMMEQILNDFNTLYAEVINLTTDVMKNFEQVNVEKDSFNKRITDIESLQKRIESSFTNRNDLLIFRDDFRDIDRFSRGATPGTPAYVSTNEGLITLSRVSGEIFNEFATITILKGDGFPGNTHVIRSSGDMLQFDGEEELHINLASILDGNADTWFEYELFELTKQAEDITQNKDIRYQEPIDWADREIQQMRCVIQIDMPKAKVMNWISLLPYIPSDRGALPAQIEKVVISDERGVVNSMAFEERFDSAKAFIFSSQKCKTITIYLRQNISYETQVGHFYFMEVNKEEIPTMDEKRILNGTRIHAPSLPSISNLNVSYDSGTGEIVYPISKYGDTINNEELKKKSLFTVPDMGSTIFAGLEQVPARRYIVGLRDINMASYQFGTVSNYVCEPFISPSPIKEVQLDAEFDIPSVFSEGDWVTFSISIDKGVSWYPIHQKNIHREGIKTKYLFNSNTPKEGRLDEYEYLETLTDIYEIQVKIELTRPGISDSYYYTPVVYNYELQVVVDEEVV